MAQTKRVTKRTISSKSKNSDEVIEQKESPKTFLGFNQQALLLIAGIVVVILVVGGIISLIRKGSILNFGASTDKATQITQTSSNTLPAKHTVASGEDLWSISEKYYNTGYNWTEIAKANNITDPNNIYQGQELTIPVVPTQEAQNASDSAMTMRVEPTTVPTVAPTQAQTQETSMTPNTNNNQQNAISGNTYTVQHGDDLWDIAVRAYGDGYKWTEIAKANNLANPSIIHSGNQLTLPR